MFGALTKWRHAGEEAATVVYSKRIAGMVVVFGILVLLAWATTRRVRRANMEITSTLFVVLGIRALAERRRAVIFTPTAVVCRPAFAAPLHVPFDRIKAVRPILFGDTLLLRPRFMPGVFVTLTNGETATFPVDFKEQSEILHRLEEACGSNAAKG